MGALPEMRRRVPVGRGVATPDMAAAEAEAEVDPATAGGEALLASGERVRPHIRFDFAEVRAAYGHLPSLTRQRRLG